MNRPRQDGHRLRAGFIVTAATLAALAIPTAAPLYASAVYPLPDAQTFGEAVAKANLRYGFASDSVTQFDPVEFTATIIYGRAVDPEQVVIRVGQSNKASLDASDPAAFDINQTSSSRIDLDTGGTRRADGGYQASWTWNVTPLKAGPQSLTLTIVPTVVVRGQVLPMDASSRNEPIDITVRVNPAQHALDQAVTAAHALRTKVPEQLVVGEKADVSASLSIPAAAANVDAKITLATAPGSAGLTIRDASAKTGAGPQRASTAVADKTVTHHWTVIADKPGPVALVFTVALAGQAGGRHLHADVNAPVTSRAVKPPPTGWDLVKAPVDYLGPFVTFGTGVVALVGAVVSLLAWRRRKLKAASAEAAEGDGR